MSDGLPDTHDPWELLGVTPDANRRAVKRAHARLIKLHRPDRDPDAFKRVQEAFEECTRRLKMRERFAGLTLVYDEAAEPHRSDASGESASARDEPAPPAPPAPSIWPAEPDDAFSGSHVEWVLRGVRSGLPMDPSILDQLSWAEFAQLAVHDELSWRALRSPRLAAVARPLHRARLEGLLLSGRMDQAVAEASASETKSDALADPELETQLWIVAAMMAWEQPDEAARLAAELGGATASDDERDPRSVYDDVRRVSLPWRNLLEQAAAGGSDKGAFPRALAAYLRASRLVGYRNTDALLSDCRLAFERDRDEALAFLDRLASQSSAVAEFAHASIALDTIDSLSRSPTGPRAVELERSLTAIEREMAAYSHVRRARRAPVWVAACLMAAVTAGGWAWIVPLVGTPAIVLRTRKRWEDAYQHLRARLVDLAAELGVPASLAREQIALNQAGYRTLGEFGAQIDADAGLQLSTEWAALAEQWARE